MSLASPAAQAAEFWDRQDRRQAAAFWDRWGRWTAENVLLPKRAGWEAQERPYVPPTLNPAWEPPTERVQPKRLRERTRRAFFLIRRDFILKRVREVTEAGMPSLDALDHIALSSVQAERWLKDQHGLDLDRKTILKLFALICGAPNGKLAEGFSESAAVYGDGVVQANTYSLRHLHVTLGRRSGRKISQLIADLLLASEGIGCRRVPQRSFGGITHNTWAVRALQRAIEDAFPGMRHAILCRLTTHLAYLGFSPGDMRPFITEYRLAVGGITGREAAKAARSAMVKFGH